MNNQEKLNAFISITNTPIEQALSILESHNWDLDTALQITPTISSDNIHNTPDTYNADESSLSQSNIFQDDIQIRNPDKSHREQLLPDLNHAEYPFSSANPSDDSLLNLIKTPNYLNETKTFSEIRSQAIAENKYILVSVRSPDVLNCIHINRDLWLHDCVKDIVASTFCCWQTDITNNEGQQFCNKYNITQFPYIGIIESSTGKVLKVIQTTNEYNDFITEICEVIKTIDEMNFSKDYTDADADADADSDAIGNAAAAESIMKLPATEPLHIIKKEFIEPTANYCTIKFSFSDNTSNITRKFGQSEKIQILYDFISQECNKSDFDILNSYPRKSLKPYVDNTLHKINLNNTTLIIKC